MKRHWSYYVSPFIIGAVGCLVPVALGILALKHEGIDQFLVILFLPVCLILLGLDYFIKSLTTGRVLYIWIVEVVLFAVLFFCLNGFSFVQRC
ncbi:MULTISPECIES: hypothetical protein [Niastella]|uniref:Lipoprotein n=1 Tax=Niastella soli TaxID=2821487 RepID=A0ABS3Z1H9_9BACT|nr:hypothetical protein [Niastella soli]MBO9204005.1 hypothetical protein [Niastella soli]